MQWKVGCSHREKDERKMRDSGKGSEGCDINTYCLG
jgi:hypothetical protein